MGRPAGPFLSCETPLTVNKTASSLQRIALGEGFHGPGVRSESLVSPLSSRSRLLRAYPARQISFRSVRTEIGVKSLFAPSESGRDGNRREIAASGPGLARRGGPEGMSLPPSPDDPSPWWSAELNGSFRFLSNWNIPLDSVLPLADLPD
jgi:hypothetical protein